MTIVGTGPSSAEANEDELRGSDVECLKCSDPNTENVREETVKERDASPQQIRSYEEHKNTTRLIPKNCATSKNC